MIYKKSWKYVLIIDDTCYRNYYRLKALKDFSDISKGNFGGYLESYYNLSQSGNCWVYNNARVYGFAQVSENACIYDEARVCGNAQVFGNAQVSGSAWIYGHRHVQICGNVNMKNLILTKGVYK